MKHKNMHFKKKEPGLWEKFLKVLQQQVSLLAEIWKSNYIGSCILE